MSNLIPRTPNNGAPVLSVRDFGCRCDGITDDSPALAAACAQLAGTGRALHVPGRLLLAGGAQVVLDGCGLVAEGTRDGGAPYGTRSGTILLTDTARAPFICKRGWLLEGLAFFWPAQVEDVSAPRTFPALLTGSGTGQSGGNEATQGRLENCDVVNAWIVADFAADVCGGLQVHRNRMYFLRAGFRLSSMPVESFFTNNQFTPNAYGNATGVTGGATTRLRDQAAQNAVVFEIVGNGTSSARSTTSVDGLNLSNNYVFGLGYGIRVLGGTLDIGSFTGNGFDAVSRVVSVETGGLVSGERINGGIWYTYTFGSPSAVTASIYSASDAAPGNNLHIGGVTAPSTIGPLVDWSAPASVLCLSDVEAPGMNSLAGGGGTASGIRFNSLGGRLKVVGGTLAMNGSAPGPGIDVLQPLQMLTVVGTQFVACGAPISVGGSYAPTSVTIAGCASAGTHGTTAYAGAMAATLPSVGNAWDQPVPGWSVATRGSDGALVTSRAGVAKLALLPDGTLRSAGPMTPSTTP